MKTKETLLSVSQPESITRNDIAQNEGSSQSFLNNEDNNLTGLLGKQSKNDIANNTSILTIHHHKLSHLSEKHNVEISDQTMQNDSDDSISQRSTQEFIPNNEIIIPFEKSCNEDTKEYKLPIIEKVMKNGPSYERQEHIPKNKNEIPLEKSFNCSQDMMVNKSPTIEESSENELSENISKETKQSATVQKNKMDHVLQNNTIFHNNKNYNFLQQTLTCQQKMRLDVDQVADIKSSHNHKNYVSSQNVNELCLTPINQSEKIVEETCSKKDMINDRHNSPSKAINEYSFNRISDNSGKLGENEVNTPILNEHKEEIRGVNFLQHLKLNSDNVLNTDDINSGSILKSPKINDESVNESCSLLNNIQQNEKIATVVCNEQDEVSNIENETQEYKEITQNKSKNEGERLNSLQKVSKSQSVSFPIDKINKQDSEGTLLDREVNQSNIKNQIVQNNTNFPESVTNCFGSLKNYTKTSNEIQTMHTRTSLQIPEDNFNDKLCYLNKGQSKSLNDNINLSKNGEERQKSRSIQHFESCEKSIPIISGTLNNNITILQDQFNKKYQFQKNASQETTEAESHIPELTVQSNFISDLNRQNLQESEYQSRQLESEKDNELMQKCNNVTSMILHKYNNSSTESSEHIQSSIKKDCDVRLWGSQNNIFQGEQSVQNAAEKQNFNSPEVRDFQQRVSMNSEKYVSFDNIKEEKQYASIKKGNTDLPESLKETISKTAHPQSTIGTIQHRTLHNMKENICKLPITEIQVKGLHESLVNENLLDDDIGITNSQLLRIDDDCLLNAYNEATIPLAPVKWTQKMMENRRKLEAVILEIKRLKYV